MGYDRGESFSFNFEPNVIPIDSKLKGKLSPRSYPIQFERKWKHSFLSVYAVLTAENTVIASAFFHDYLYHLIKLLNDTVLLQLLLRTIAGAIFRYPSC